MAKIFDIPVPVHLLKFASKQYFTGQKQPYFISERTLIGQHLFTLITDARSLEPLTIKSTSTLQIELSNELAKRSPTLTKLIRLNRFLEELFKSHLKCWVNAQMRMSGNKYQAVKDFLLYYDILNDSLLERYYLYLKRDLPYRFRQKTEIFPKDG